MNEEQNGLRLDTHVHTHPIPLQFDALCEVIKENNYVVEYIRNPKEPLKPFIKNTSLWSTYSLVNVAKNFILNAFSHKIHKYCDSKRLRKNYMWGLMMSGEMDFDRIKILYKDMVSFSEKNNRDLEILFHPGIALSKEYSKEFKLEYFNNANLSNNRNVEKNAVMNIRELTN